MARRALIKSGAPAGAWLLMLLIAGCATTPPVPPVDWHRAKAERQQLERWQMKGRAAVATQNNGWNASVATSSPSTAESTEMAGVIMPSP